MKIPTMIDRKFSKYPGAVNWNKRARDEQQRALNEFLKAGFLVFLFFLTGWQVELGAKDVQGSARLSKCLLNNAVVPKGKREENKTPPPTRLTATTLVVDLEESSRMDEESYG